MLPTLPQRGVCLFSRCNHVKQCFCKFQNSRLCFPFFFFSPRFGTGRAVSHRENMKEPLACWTGRQACVDRWWVQLICTRRSPGRMDESSVHQLFLAARPQNSFLLVMAPNQNVMLTTRGQSAAASVEDSGA